MKPKTKKTLIIMLAVVAILVIVWLVVRKRRKNDPEAIISHLKCDKGVQDALRAMVSYIGTSWDDAHKQAIADHAADYGRTLAQQTVAEAAYALLDANQIDAATYNAIVAQI